MKRRRLLSFTTSEAGQIGDQVMDVGCGQAILVCRHQTFSELLFNLAQIRLSKRVELIVGIAQLNRERIFVDARTPNFATLSSDDTHRQELVEIAGRNYLTSVREHAPRIQYRLTEIVRTALASNTCQLWPRRAALTVYDVARRASRALINAASLLWIPYTRARRR